MFGDQIIACIHESNIDGSILRRSEGTKIGIVADAVDIEDPACNTTAIGHDLLDQQLAPLCIGEGNGSFLMGLNFKPVHILVNKPGFIVESTITITGLTDPIDAGFQIITASAFLICCGGMEFLGACFVPVDGDLPSL